MNDRESARNDVRTPPPGNKDRRARPPTPAGGERYEPIHDASIYDSIVDPTAENDAHSLVIRLTGENKRVLELGCATGSMTKVLQERGCRVVGIEIDVNAAQIAEQFCERIIVADLDLLDIDEALGDDTFDVIVAADVLEHLRNPQRVMTTCLGHLRDEGEVVLSIPNIAHADARLALLRGDFDYHWCGILDETHMRFFTRRTLETFLHDCGLVALDWDRTHRPLGETEIEWRPPHDAALLDWIAGQPDWDTYQFVVRAASAPVGSHLRELGTRLRDLDAAHTAENDGLRARIDQLNTHIEGLTADIEGLNANIVVLTTKINELTSDDHDLRQAATEAESEIANLRANIRVVQKRSAEELADSRTETIRLERDLQERLAELNELRVERDEYRSSFQTLVGVQEELVALRRSESFRLGRALLAPAVSGRRIARAWLRAKPSP